ncbi:Alcohol dehydrogenase, zinc-binding protein [Paraglaciecola sp. T6c]|uniref:zinc-binding alcohol dehydrogenase family protein n=1 Tax=Pseudoalteromonas atlantica (strain T6c / ATCC BAA-1087) TaxID=3042615 RepID=UPI00005C7147|nr:zinc-binding alcohol dehydrogenase family protein [Paraglaciecola sp. T6c]ABG41150.1 Alcohol dehydrogenase, zinc-binding protein [Paraglaciecola sp. T6c]
MSVPKQMNAIGFTQSLPIEEQNSLFKFTMPIPTLGENDMLVRVVATSINPADAKNRALSAIDTPHPQPVILGYDAVGIVEALGKNASGFSVGDKVYYAGDVTRAGSNSEYQAVDHRIVAHAPTSQSDAQAAVMPLVSLTAYEALFDRLRVSKTQKKTLLIIGGAGGVGSIAIQLAKQLTNLTVIATASRPETEKWVRSMGADYVVNHRNLLDSTRESGFQHVDYIFNVADTQGHWDAMVELIAPQGMISSIVEVNSKVDISPLAAKSAGFVWELMFTRSMFNTSDIVRQQDILAEIAQLLDQGSIKSTLTQTFNGFNVDTFKEAHSVIESGKSIGKTAVIY